MSFRERTGDEKSKYIVALTKVGIDSCKGMKESSCNNYRTLWGDGENGSRS